MSSDAESSDTESRALHGRVLEFARASLRAGSLPESFEQLALAIARYQREHNPALAALARHYGRNLAALAELPAVPADAFRRGRVAAHDRALDVARFHTSGTTGSSGVHAFRTLDTYRELTLAWGRQALLFHLPERSRVTVLALAPPFEPERRSSLGFMLQEFMRSFDGRALSAEPGRELEASEPGRWLVAGSDIDVGGLRAGIAAAERRGEPVLLLATSFALVWLLESLGRERLPLPAGSVVMHTGGFKGRTRSVDPAELAKGVLELFALEPRHLIAEYGMTELSSQLYDAGYRPDAPAGSVFSMPPWLRVEPVDPLTFAPVAQGEAGLARFIDLANVDSALCVLTQDYVRLVPGGVVLIGRKPRTRLRGCSLAIEELAAPRASNVARPDRTEAATAPAGASWPSKHDADALSRVRRLIEATRRATRSGSAERAMLRADLVITTGLPEAHLDAALDTCLELEPSQPELDALVASVRRSERAHVILPANVFVAAHRALALALASAPRVFVKPSRRDAALARAIWAQAPELFELVSELPVQSGDHVWAYGSDTTLAELRRELPRGAILHAHGEGFGLALVDLQAPEGVAAGDRERQLAAAIARDVGWFDQRGCLSPRFVLVRGSERRASAFAQHLAAALAECERGVPRGRLDEEEAGDAVWYKACAACFGPVLPAGQGAVAVRLTLPLQSAAAIPSGSSPRALDAFMDVPPLGRHVEVVPAEHFEPLLSALSPWLTCIGVSHPGLEAVARRTAPRARITALGTMQKPAFDGPADLRSDPGGERL